MHFEKQVVTLSSNTTAVTGTYTINGAIQAINVKGGSTDIAYKLFRHSTHTHNKLMNLYFPSSCYRYHPRIHFNSTAGGAVDISSGWANDRHVFVDCEVKILVMTTAGTVLPSAEFNLIVEGQTSS